MSAEGQQTLDKYRNRLHVPADWDALPAKERMWQNIQWKTLTGKEDEINEPNRKPTERHLETQTPRQTAMP